MCLEWQLLILFIFTIIDETFAVQCPKRHLEWLILILFIFTMVEFWYSIPLDAPRWGPPAGARFTNSRTIFFFFTNSGTREKYRVSRFHERDFVNSPIPNHKCIGVHEQIFQFSRIQERYFFFSRITNDIIFTNSRTIFTFTSSRTRKKNNFRFHERRWGDS